MQGNLPDHLKNSNCPIKHRVASMWQIYEQLKDIKKFSIVLVEAENEKDGQ
jgi:hypothetical protein